MILPATAASSRSGEGNQSTPLSPAHSRGPATSKVLAQALGYEDLNDHDTLRDDALLALAAGKRDLTGARRRREADRGHALAGRSTLNRLELTPADATAASRYQKIVYHGEAIEDLFVDHFLDAHAQPPEQVLLDLDVTDDALHGHQERALPPRLLRPLLLPALVRYPG